MSDFLKKFIVYGVLSGTGAAVNILAVQLIIQNLGIATFTELSKIVLYATLLGTFACFSCQTWLMNRVTEQGLPELTNILFFLFFNAILCTPLLFYLLDSEFSYLTYTAAFVYTCTTSITICFIALIQFLQKTKKYIVYVSLNICGNILGLVLVLKLEGIEIEYRLVVVSIFQIFTALIFTYKYSGFSCLNLVSDLGSLYRWGFRLSVHNIGLIWILGADRIIVEKNYDEFTFGYVAALFTILTPFNILYTQINNVVRPKVYQAIACKDRQLYGKWLRIHILANFCNFLASGIFVALSVYYFNFGTIRDGLSSFTIFMFPTGIFFLAFYYNYSNILMYNKKTLAISFGTVGIGVGYFFVFTLLRYINFSIELLVTLLVFLSIVYAFYYYLMNWREAWKFL